MNANSPPDDMLACCTMKNAVLIVAINGMRVGLNKNPKMMKMEQKSSAKMARNSVRCGPRPSGLGKSGESVSKCAHL